MQVYRAPLDDVRFVLGEVLGYETTVATLSGYEEATLDAAMEILAEAARLCEGVLLPLNRTGDEEGCVLENGEVRTPAGFRDAYRELVVGGWLGLDGDPEHGGAGLPRVMWTAFDEMLCASNVSLETYAALTHSAGKLLLRHGSGEQKDRYAGKLVSGEWAGTMCLTEPHAGTDLGMIATRAEAAGDGAYRVTGTKIFVTAGEHDLTESIVHLVLAKLPDAPAGVKGISLFIVPKHRPGPGGGPAERNAVVCGSIEHKMGLGGSATCTLHFEGAHAELVGEPHTGVASMFTMMNASRIDVGIQGIGIGEIAYQSAAAYARERLQGRSPAGPQAPDLPADPIIVHPDVRRALLRARALTEGGRALALWLSVELDVAERHPDERRRQEADDLVALLTPVVKAACTDNGVEAANLALGVFGGHGYIRETGVEQLARDGRIAQIYEGTNGIQALDLVRRKLGLHEGRLPRRFFDRVEGFCEEHGRDAELADFVGPLADAVRRLRRTTEWLVERGAADAEELAAAATDYLRLFALVTFAYLWARTVRACLDPGQPASPELREAKLATARFYMTRVLPEAVALEQVITAGKGPLMALPAEAF